VKFVGGLPGLRARYGIRWTRQYINRLERSGKFPKKVELGHNTKDWVEEEIADWCAAKVRARDAAE
jgi:prophage regulatory protein